MKMSLKTLLGTAALLGLATSAQAQVIYSTVGGNYTQNFNWTVNGTGTSQVVTWTSNAATQPFSGVVNWTGNSTGWYAGNGTADSPSIRAGNGNDTNNVSINISNFYFSSSDTDRSFGGRPTSSVPMAYALRLTNNTGITLTQFTLGYRLETTSWRANGPQTTANVSYFIGNPIPYWGNATFTSAASLNLTSVYGGDTTANNQNVNGNASGNFTSTNGTITGLSWGNGTDLWIRWSFANVANSPNVGLDDVTFSAVPEPTAWVLLAGGLTALVAFRRRRMS